MNTKCASGTIVAMLYTNSSLLEGPKCDHCSANCSHHHHHQRTHLQRLARYSSERAAVKAPAYVHASLLLVLCVFEYILSGVLELFHSAPVQALGVHEQGAQQVARYCSNNLHPVSPLANVSKCNNMQRSQAYNG
jgi:hypothetical protein